METHLIWAQDENGGIGSEGKLPWHISEDLKNFKFLTLNSIVIMGRNTWDSLPYKPLRNRRNIVFSKTQKLGVETFQSLDECLAKLQREKVDKIFIIGGRSIYKLFYSMADYLHITDVKFINKDINEFFPISYKAIKKEFNQINQVVLNKNAIYGLWRKNK